MRGEQPNHAANPFPGLRPFEFAESHLFFGREGQSEDLLRKLRQTRFLAVVGTSGSGKSSLVRAGLLPLLCGGFMRQVEAGWQIAVFRPGNNPIRNLARALNAPDSFDPGHPPGNGGAPPAPPPEADARPGAAAHRSGLRAAAIEAMLRRSGLGLAEHVKRARLRKDENLLIVVDQFEELFRFQHSAALAAATDEAAAFVKLLLEATASADLPVYVVMTMRSDFLGDCAVFRDLPERINDGQYLIPRMTREQQRKAIAAPAAVRGAAMTPRLVRRLLNDMGDNPDQLPILQHALMRTWGAWARRAGRGEVIDLADYEAIGGMTHALSRHADEAFNELPEDDGSREIAMRLFQALTETVQEGREIRRPARLREIHGITSATIEQVSRVVEVFRREGRSFLMPPPRVPLEEDTLLDISHESLIQGWAKLKEWVADEARSAQEYRRLADAATRYAAGSSNLWRDLDLSAALKWERDSKPNEAWAQRYGGGFEAATAFLRESEASYAAELKEKTERENALILAREQQAQAEKRSAEAESQRAHEARLRAEAEQRRAEKERRVAELEAESQRRVAEQSRKLAEEQERLREVESQRAEAESRRAEAEALRAREQAEAARKLRRLVAALVVMFLVAAGAAAYAFAQRREALRSAAEANEQREIAEKNAVEADKNAMMATEQAKLAEQRRAETETARAQAAALAASEAEQRKRAEASAVEARRQAQIAEASRAETEKARAQAAALAASEARQRQLADARSAELAKALEQLESSLQREDQQVYDLGRQEMVSGNPLRALVYLDRVYPKRSDSAPVKFLLAEALRSVDAERASLTKGGHEGRVTSAVFSPDDQLVVTTSEDKTARLWDKNGNLIGTLTDSAGQPSHKSRVNAAAFSPEGEYIATASNDRTAKLWDKRGNFLGALGHDQSVVSVAFSPDGSRVVTASNDGTAKVWRVKDRTLARTLPHPAPVRHAVFKDFTTVVTACDDGKVRVWAADTEMPPDILNAHTGSVLYVAPAPTRDGFATAGADRRVFVWMPMAQGGYTVLAGLEGHKDEVTRVAYSRGNPDEKGCRRIVTASKDETAKVWDACNGSLLFTLAGHASDVVSAEFSRDYSRIVTGSRDGTAKLWDAKTGKLMLSLEGHTDGLFSAAFSFDGRRVVTASSDKAAKIWDVDKTSLFRRYRAHKDPVRAVDFAPGGELALTVDGDDTLRGWNFMTGVNSRLQVADADTGISFAASSPKGGRLATISNRSNRIQIRDAQTGAVQRVIEDGDPQDFHNSVMFDEEGERIVVTGRAADRQWVAKIYSLPSSADPPAATELKGHSAPVNFAAFSRDGKQVVTASNDETAKIWDAATGNLVAELRGHRSDVYAAVYSGDGARVVTAGRDRTAKVWDAKTGKLLISLNGHLGRVYFAEFSHDGTRIVTAGGDGTAKVWDAATGALLATLEGHSGEVFQARFTPDDQKIVTVSADQTAVVWDVHLETRVPDQVKQIVSRLPLRLDEGGRLVDAP